ncbi:hypothetical protein CAOG_03911 [Capsaspora owczarzaki ATCC 30864]|uniref:HTH La-type RNA-binding domain-containing protein n=1 Tax=Capsaspora owczarzaki (strain ATCC 30864) TaxID=595528 RepID=A0A0D2X2S4_CAPO3|nr:hypothetical protein CAOG_03911 [Capsaspora owczarzaki ATCC 30864]KJE93064.1 hypothetical protein CAOG_003911 [Capsaspora owczarzaki ATCC 30864]|eukprot:XP_004363639.2 hypothetical protein CAOG_03911 [Capsaspora owczarzaki ATCC 30864]
MTQTQTQDAHASNPSQTMSNEASPSSSPIARNGEDELRQALTRQLEHYFRLEHLAQDAYLVAQMSADHYVAIRVLASFPSIQQLTTDIALITDVLRASPLVEVDAAGERARPVEMHTQHRNTIILRDIDASTPADTIRAEVFDTLPTSLPRPVSIRADVQNTWFVTFDASEDQVRDVHLALVGKTFQGNPVRARVKSENIVRTSGPARGAAAAGFAADGVVTLPGTASSQSSGSFVPQPQFFQQPQQQQPQQMYQQQQQQQQPQQQQQHQHQLHLMQPGVSYGYFDMTSGVGGYNPWAVNSGQGFYYDPQQQQSFGSFNPAQQQQQHQQQHHHHQQHQPQQQQHQQQHQRQAFAHPNQQQQHQQQQQYFYSDQPQQHSRNFRHNKHHSHHQQQSHAQQIQPSLLGQPDGVSAVRQHPSSSGKPGTHNNNNGTHKLANGASTAQAHDPSLQQHQHQHQQQHPHQSQQPHQQQENGRRRSASASGSSAALPSAVGGTNGKPRRKASEDSARARGQASGGAAKQSPVASSAPKPTLQLGAANFPPLPSSASRKNSELSASSSTSSSEPSRPSSVGPSVALADVVKGAPVSVSVSAASSSSAASASETPASVPDHVAPAVNRASPVVEAAPSVPVAAAAAPVVESEPIKSKTFSYASAAKAPATAPAATAASQSPPSTGTSSSADARRSRTDASLQKSH